MNHRALTLLLVVCAAALPLAGCTAHAEVEAPAAPPGEVVVTQAPPAPQVEVIPVAPSTNHVWIAGHWHWNGGAWVWRAGHYEIRRVGWHWVPAHYSQRGASWVYVSGYWAR